MLLGGHFVIACVCLYWYLWFYENWYLVTISCKFYLGFNKSAVAFPFFIVNPEITWETPEKLWSLKIKTWLNFKPDLKSFIDWNLDLIWRSLEPLIPGSKWATGNLISSQTQTFAVRHRTFEAARRVLLSFSTHHWRTLVARQERQQTAFFFCKTNCQLVKKVGLLPPVFQPTYEL